MLECWQRGEKPAKFQHRATQKFGVEGFGKCVRMTAVYAHLAPQRLLDAAEDVGAICNDGSTASEPLRNKSSTSLTAVFPSDPLALRARVPP